MLHAARRTREHHDDACGAAGHPHDAQLLRIASLRSFRKIGCGSLPRPPTAEIFHGMHAPGLNGFQMEHGVSGSMAAASVDPV